MVGRIYAPKILAAAVTAATIALGALPCDAQAEVSFKGKTIKIIINSKPGGGTDANARLIGAHLARHLPGEPTVVFQNLPGGGGIKANNYFFAKVLPDGQTLLSGSRTQISPTKLRHKGVKYNPAQYSFVGGTERLGTVILVRKEERHRLLDPKAKPLVYGGIDGERTGAIAGAWAKEYLGWNIKYLLGYPGAADMFLAARRREIDMVANQNVSNVMPMVKDGLEPVVQIGVRDESGKMVPRTSFSKIGVFDELIRPKLKGPALKAYQTWLDDQLVDKWIALPPKTPADMVAAHRAAFLKAVKDPKFMEIAKQEFGEDFGVYSGAAMDKIVKSLVETSDDDLAFLVNLRKKHGLPVR